MQIKIYAIRFKGKVLYVGQTKNEVKKRFECVEIHNGEEQIRMKKGTLGLNKDNFVNNIKNELDVTAYNALNAIKKELATDFIKGDNNDTAKSEE